MNTEKYISVHRFGDKVSFCTDSSPTLYLSKEMAEGFAKALLQYAKDVDRVSFPKSTLTTTNIEE